MMVAVTLILRDIKRGTKVRKTYTYKYFYVKAFC